MPAISTRLDYAPPAPRRSLKPWLLSLVLVAGSILVAVLCWDHVERLRITLERYRQHRDDMRRQTQLLTHVGRAAAFAYDEDPRAAAGDAEHAAGYEETVGPRTMIRAVVYRLPELKRLQEWIRTTDVIFCHGRSTAAVGERLVVVSTHNGWWNADMIREVPLCVQLVVPMPADSTYGAYPQLVPQRLGPRLMLRPDERIRFRFGRPHPGDGRLFTIGYDVNGRAGEIEGRLSDDGATVRWRHMHGPAGWQAADTPC